MFNCDLNVKVLVGALNQENALVGAFSVVDGCEICELRECLFRALATRIKTDMQTLGTMILYLIPRDSSFFLKNNNLNLSICADLLL